MGSENKCGNKRQYRWFEEFGYDSGRVFLYVEFDYITQRGTSHIRRLLILAFLGYKTLSEILKWKKLNFISEWFYATALFRSERLVQCNFLNS